MSGNPPLIYNSDTWSTVTFEKVAAALNSGKSLLVRNNDGSPHDFLERYEVKHYRDTGYKTISNNTTTTPFFHLKQCRDNDGATYTAIGQYSGLSRPTTTEVDLVLRDSTMQHTSSRSRRDDVCTFCRLPADT